MNAAEKYVLTTRAYMGQSGSALVGAIKGKDFEGLLAVVRAGKGSNGRKSAITEKLGVHFKKHLYRNVESGCNGDAGRHPGALIG